MDPQIKEKLSQAANEDEVRAILSDTPELDPKRVWKEIEAHRSNKSEKLDLNELDAVSGGADRDWKKDGCAATCEWTSWCWSNDYCAFFDVTYDNFWVCCPDGQPHVFNNDAVCTRCGYAANCDGDDPG